MPLPIRDEDSLGGDFSAMFSSSESSLNAMRERERHIFEGNFWG